jgi:hypothetical protein
MTFARAALGWSEGFSMAEDIASRDETHVVTVANGWRRPPMTQRDAARSQVLWMAGQASRAARSGRVDDARWWHERAVCALWNMS